MPALKSRELRFGTSAEWNRGHEALLRVSGKGVIPVACPPEFCEGPGDLWSPEELFVGAVETCILMTFLYYADLRGLRYTGYRSRAEGTVAMTGGKFCFREIRVELAISLDEESEREKALDLVRKAEEVCLVSHSLKTPVTVIPTISVG